MIAVPDLRAPAADAGDTRFLAFLEAHKGILYKVAYIYCRDAEERRDLMQDMAIQLWRAFDRYDGRAAISTWAYRVAMNVAISHRRSESRRIRKALPLEFAFDVAAADTAFASDTAPSRDLLLLIDGLDEMGRALLLLYLDGFDHGEIAATLGTTPGNVATRLNRIKRRLQAGASATGE